jgi:anti-sigma factor RsiW
MAAIFGRAAGTVPAAWIARIEAATAPTLGARRVPRWRPLLGAIAAAILIALIGTYALNPGAPADTILADALDARSQTLAPSLSLAGASLPPAPARDALLHASLHMKLHAPDLSRFGFQLTRLDTYRPAGGVSVGLRYRDARARELTIFVRASSGQVRFDLLRRGDLRVCVWQDDVVGAVMAGQMSAGEMMRVASGAYAALNL